MTKQSRTATDVLKDSCHAKPYSDGQPSVAGCQNDCRTPPTVLLPNFQITLKCFSIATYNIKPTVGTSFANKVSEEFSLPLWSYQHISAALLWRQVLVQWMDAGDVN